MKIIHVSTPLSWRGGEQQIAYLCLELRKVGIEQMVVCRQGSKMEDFCKRENLAFTGLKKRTSLDPGFARKLSRLVKDQKADIVHPHDSHAHTFCIVAARLFGMKTPIVLHRRVDYPVKNTRASYYKYNHPQIEKIICVSRKVKRILDQSLKDTTKSLVIYSGIDLEKFDRNSRILRQEYGIPPSKTIIGNVAAITQQKDYFTFVATAQKILEKNQEVHFFIVGDGDQRTEITRLVTQKGLDSYFTYTGFRSDIHRVLPSLDILLFPSEKEGLGTTILDAFAAGVPVVASNAGGIPELIKQAQNGFIAPVKNPDELARYCLLLLERPDLRQKISFEAFKTAQTFSKENMAQQVLKVYEKVLQGRL